MWRMIWLFLAMVCTLKELIFVFLRWLDMVTANPAWLSPYKYFPNEWWAMAIWLLFVWNICLIQEAYKQEGRKHRKHWTLFNEFTFFLRRSKRHRTTFPKIEYNMVFPKPVISMLLFSLSYVYRSFTWTCIKVVLPLCFSLMTLSFYVDK